MVSTITVFSCEALDRIARFLVRDPDATMSNASLLRWYSKAAPFDRPSLLAVTDDLLSFACDGAVPDRLARLVSDFPDMVAWFGEDIAGSDRARVLLFRIKDDLSRASLPDFAPHAFCDPARLRLQESGVLSITENLLGLQGDLSPFRLVVVGDLWDPFFVMPDTIVCFRDDTFSTYVAMIGHEGTHLLTLSLVNDPSVISGIPSDVAQSMAEALAQAVQMIATEECGISYQALFRGTSITDHLSYLRAHPGRARMEPMVLRMMDQLRERHGRPLRHLYRQVLEEFANGAPAATSSAPA